MNITVETKWNQKKAKSNTAVLSVTYSAIGLRPRLLLWEPFSRVNANNSHQHILRTGTPFLVVCLVTPCKAKPLEGLTGASQYLAHKRGQSTLC